MAETVCHVLVVTLHSSQLGLPWMHLRQLLRVCSCGLLSLFLALFSHFGFTVITLLSSLEAPVPF